MRFVQEPDPRLVKRIEELEKVVEKLALLIEGIVRVLEKKK